MSKYLSSPSLDDDEETNHAVKNGQSQSVGVAKGGQPNDNLVKSIEAAADGAFSPKKKQGAASRLFAMQGRKTVMMEKAVVVSGAGCDKVNGV